MATDADALVRLEECDEWDRPTGTLVVLCSGCERRLVGPHPRLYRSVQRWTPLAGSMELCVDCRFRAELACIHPSLRKNGGPGLEIIFPKPEGPVHLYYGGGKGEFTYLYVGPASSCAGREAGR